MKRADLEELKYELHWKSARAPNSSAVPLLSNISMFPLDMWSHPQHCPVGQKYDSSTLMLSCIVSNI